MSKSTPKKTAQSKTVKKAPEPMDTSVREALVGTPASNTKRTCHAIKQLVAEVAGLFPETPVEYSNYDGRNTALDVTFDMSVFHSTGETLFASLLSLVESDERVREVIDEDRKFLVGMVSSPRLQDSRAPFGLDDAYAVLVGLDDEFTGEIRPEHSEWLEGSR
jgi:hypothetical protein